jgi:Domain of unknown function (DUF4149)
MTKLCYLHLPRPQFTSLQKKVFPVYFSLQVGLVVLTTVTYPPGSLFSLLQRGNWSEIVPLALNAAMAALNAWVYGPRTQRVMVERIHQGELLRMHYLLSSPLPFSSLSTSFHPKGGWQSKHLLHQFHRPLRSHTNFTIPLETKDSRKSVPEQHEQQQQQQQQQQEDQNPSDSPRPVALPISDDMKRINRTFSRNHAMAIHLNAIAVIATVWYGFALASRMQIIA